jgi:hypothetical protein
VQRPKLTPVNLLLNGKEAADEMANKKIQTNICQVEQCKTAFLFSEKRKAVYDINQRS